MDIKDVENLANLARIELSDDEKASMLEDMKSILAYVKTIEEVQVEDMQGDYTVHNVWREDAVIKREFSADLLIEQFPNKQDNFLKVKKIL